MSKDTYIGVDGVARKIKAIYIGVDGVARLVKEGYVGIDGVARKFWPSIIPVIDIIDVETDHNGYFAPLSGTVIPSNATHRTIIWSVDEPWLGIYPDGYGGYWIDAAGTPNVSVKATIINGLGIGKDFIKIFEFSFASG